MTTRLPDAQKTAAIAVYGLYIVSTFSGLPAVIGLIVAYVFRADAAQWVGSHLHFQIRTFWIGLLYGIVGLLLIPLFLLGWLLLGVVGFWWLIRCINGLRHLLYGNEYPRPYNWLW